jgi:hypothetical protein
LNGLAEYIVQARCYAPGPVIIELNTRDDDGTLLDGEKTILRISSAIERNSIMISLKLYSTCEMQHDDFITYVDGFFRHVALKRDCSSLFEGEDFEYGDYYCVATFKDHAAVWETEFLDADELNGVGYEYCARVCLEVANFRPSQTPVILIDVLKCYAPSDSTKWNTIKNEVLQDKVLAFAMALHTRLGSGALAHMISYDTLKMIAVGMIWGTMDNANVVSKLKEMRI